MDGSGSVREGRGGGGEGGERGWREMDIEGLYD